MKRVFFLLIFCAIGLSSYSQYVDDLYAPHDRRAIAREKEAQAAAMRAIIEKQSLEDINSAGKDGYYADDYVSDDYEESYERRLRGFSSLSYKMPGSYYTYYYNPDVAWKVSGYDPAFYNLVAVGDQIWVEPRYVTAMFGSWGSSVNINLNFGNWYRPSWGWGPYYGWNNPWGDPYWGWHGHHHNYPSWGYPGGGYWGPTRYTDRNVVYGSRRPTMMGSGSSSTSGGSYNDGNVVRRRGSTVGGTNYTSPSSNTTYQRRGTTVTTTPNRTPSGTTNNNSGTTTYQRRGSNSSSSSSSNSSSSSPSTYERRSSSTPSYSAPTYSSPSSSGGGSSSYGGGRSSGGGSSSGGGGGYQRR